MLINKDVASEGSITSGATPTIWLDTIQQKVFKTLDKNIETDVLIVGGGLAGITTAYCLCKAGKEVCVIEDGLLFSGETGRTTAHLAYALDDFYFELMDLHGQESTKLIAESHTAAINFIEKNSKELNIDCDFKRLDGYLFLDPRDELKTLEEEFSATQELGLPTEMVQTIPGINFEDGPALKFPNQAQFHPLKYLNALVTYITTHGGKIYTHTHAEDFKKDLVTANGFEIKANHIVVATNSPINNLLTEHTKQHAYRTYVVGALVPREAIKNALWWDTGNPESKWVSYPYHYARLQNYNEEHDLLIVGGEDHKTGQEDAEPLTQEDRYRNLINWTKERFPLAGEFIYKWSGQVMEPVDGIAYIGKNPGDENVYIITGDSGNGMTHGTIGGMLVSDLILGKENAWEKVYDPRRISFKATGDFLKEVGNMAVQYGDFLKAGDIKNLNELEKGKGAVMNAGLHKVAVYKNEEGTVEAYTAVCPHLGCVVQWNEGEQTFDCPCHGSRFTNKGVVINGPALSNLKKFEIKDLE